SWISNAASTSKSIVKDLTRPSMMPPRIRRPWMARPSLRPFGGPADAGYAAALACQLPPHQRNRDQPHGVDLVDRLPQRERAPQLPRPGREQLVDLQLPDQVARACQLALREGHLVGPGVRQELHVREVPVVVLDAD